MKNKYNLKIHFYWFQIVFVFHIFLCTNVYGQRIKNFGGVYTIDKTQPNSGFNFSSFTDAINDLNSAGSLIDTLILSVASGQQFIENPPDITNTGFSYARIFFVKSGGGANPKISASGTSSNPYDAGLCIRGGDFISFDGIDIEARDSLLDIGLLIINASQTDGAKSNFIHNCKITMTYSNPNAIAILQTANKDYANGITTTSASGANNNNTYQDIIIGKTNAAIIIYGSSQSNPDLNTSITSSSPLQPNQIGRDSINADIGNNSTAVVYGIYAFYQSSLQIKQTKFSQFANTSNPSNILYVSNSSNVSCSGITFSNLYSSGVMNLSYFSVVQGLNYNNNQSSNIRTNGSILYHFYVSGGPSIVVSNNYASNIHSGAALYAWYFNNAGNFTANNNTFIQSDAQGTFYGIYAVSPNNFSVHHNIIRNITNTNGAAYGGYFTAVSGLSNNIFSNNFRSIQLTSSTFAANVYGLTIAHNTSQNVSIKIYNNFISGIYNAYNPSVPTSTKYTYGLHLPTTTNTTFNTNAIYEIIHNSICIDNSIATNTSTAVLFLGANSIASSVPIYHIRNNSFSNLTTSNNALTRHYIIYSQSSSANYIAQTTSTINANQYYYSSVNGQMAYLTNDIHSITDWLSNCPSYDSNSVYGHPLYNSNENLLPLPSSNLYHAALFNPLYAEDYFGKIRNALSASIGACDSFIDNNPPDILLQSITSVNSFSNFIIPALATITDNISVDTSVGKAPRLYYKRKSNANAFGLNVSTTNGWKFVEANSHTNPYSFTLDFSKLYGLNQVWDTIEYFVVAQDNSPISNTASFPIDGFVASSINSISQAPFHPLYFVVFPPAAPIVQIKVEQISGNNIEAGSANNAILRVLIETQANGGPAYVNSFMASTYGGGNDTANIKISNVYFTAKDSNFFVGNLFASKAFNSTYTSSNIGNYIVSGKQLIMPGKNYFWLSYSLKPSAIPGDSLDASIDSISYDQQIYVLSNPSPPGLRYIKQSYCNIIYPQGCQVDYISNVSLKSLNNSSTCSNGMYTYYSNLIAPKLKIGSSDTLYISYGPDITQFGRAWIDYNDDGDFQDLDEDLGEQFPANANLNGTSRIVFTIPCHAKTGFLRMRIRGGDDLQPLAGQSCGAAVSTYGECEDYTIEIIDRENQFNPIAIIQDSSAIAPNTQLATLLHLKFLSSGCTPKIVNQLFGKLAGTTNIQDIQAIYLYSSNNKNSFVNAHLLASIYNPSFTFNFNSIFDTIQYVESDTIHYWIACKIGNANLNNLIDAAVDSMDVDNQIIRFSLGNPLGNRKVTNSINVLNYFTFQPETSPMTKGSSNNVLLGFWIENSSTGASLPLQNIELASGLSTLQNSIRDLKIWYTAHSNLFDTLNLYAIQNGPMQSIQNLNGNLSLTSGIHYFWITCTLYDTITTTGVLDAASISFVLNGTQYIFTSANPIGERSIITDYCKPISGTAINTTDFIQRVELDSLLNLSSYSYYNQNYNFYSIARTTLIPGQTHQLKLYAGASSSSDFAAWIDYNQNGIFETSEKVGEQMNILGTPGMAIFNFIVPLDAPAGLTRMRVRESNQTNPTLDPCLTYPNGEVEDYAIHIAPRSPAIVYRFVNTNGDYDVANSWHPIRNKKNIQDILRFSNGTMNQVLNFQGDRIRCLQIDSNTQVYINPLNMGAVWQVDSIVSFNSGTLELRNNSNLQLGIDSSSLGNWQGNPLINGNIILPINNNISYYEFPLADKYKSRKLSINVLQLGAGKKTITATFIPGIPGSAGLPLIASNQMYTRLAQEGYWQITSDLNSPNYDLNIEADSIKGLFNPSTTGILFRTDALSNWLDSGLNNNVLYASSHGKWSKNNFKQWGQFSIASDNSNPLPIEKVNFNSKFISKQSSQINWTIQTQTPYFKFRVEKSVNGDPFVLVAFENAHSTNEYAVFDKNISCINNCHILYKLYGIDVNGHSTFLGNSLLINNSINDLQIVPNPAHDYISILNVVNQSSPIEIQFYSLQGQMIDNIQMNSSADFTKIPIPNIIQQAKGFYMIRVKNANTEIFQKLLIN